MTEIIYTTSVDVWKYVRDKKILTFTLIDTEK
jgi:hypothetical protein